MSDTQYLGSNFTDLASIASHGDELIKDNVCRSKNTSLKEETITTQDDMEKINIRDNIEQKTLEKENTVTSVTSSCQNTDSEHTEHSNKTIEDNKRENDDSLYPDKSTIQYYTDEKNTSQQLRAELSEHRDNDQIEMDREQQQRKTQHKQEALAKLRSQKIHDTYNEYDVSMYDEHSAEEQYKLAKEKYTYFWKSDSVFSQWHPSKFKDGEIKFTCAEQFMMYKKAILFGSDDIAKEILKTNSPRRMKSLGRQVEQFKDNTWVWHCLHVVKEASLKKFTQNPEMRNELFSTYPTVLVEASPMDTIWGIGLDKHDQRAWNEDTWLGLNLLGYTLTEVRDELMVNAKIINDDQSQIFLPEIQDKLFDLNVQRFPGTYV